MATVPNRYYNSPWIADAGRNLAAALAPPDQEKLLAVQKEKLALQMLQEQRQETIDDRAKRDAGYAALGRIFNTPSALVEAKSPGEAAYQASQYPNGLPTGPNPEDIKTVIGSGIPLGDLYSALGTDSPLYKQKAGLAGLTNDRMLQMLLLRQGGNMDLEMAREKAAKDYHDQTDARIRDLSASLEQAKRDIAAAHEAAATGRAQIVAGGKNDPNKPINLQPTQYAEIDKGNRHFLAGLHVQVPQNLVSALNERTAYYYKKGYNEAPAMARKWLFGDEPQIIKGNPHRGNPFVDAEPDTLALRGGQDLPTLLASPDPYLPDQAPQFSSAFDNAAGAGAPAAPAAQAPAPAVESQPSPDKIQHLKEGQITIFDDGEAWALINGQPHLIPPEKLKAYQGAQ